MINWLSEFFKPRTIFALMFYGTYCSLISIHKEVPDTLENIVLMLMAFYFGNKTKGGGDEKMA